ncbi:hypothetical protein EDB81DRAFT_912638 [Dactylonectria macrodidyma]|uniref:Uncharacterized protein n=1 Tax=Dactylonectria macrodidyma TaxID=307937 RepID=A0A9P9DS99_9HYPO|nr:hypothetical protein EDB81DRAFT_912638 [Dactylonectria macrodidyma]
MLLPTCHFAQAGPIRDSRKALICYFEWLNLEDAEASPPFPIQLLERENEHGADASRRDLDQLLSLLPASYSTDFGDLAAVGLHVSARVENELDLQRLTSIHGWLWVAGRPMLPRPLHHQLVGREIVATERRITCSTRSIVACVEIFVEQLDTERIYPHIDPRFYHGERRLSQLRKIYCLQRNLLHGYMPCWNQNSDFICNNLALLASSTVYIAIMLTTMQVGLGTKLRDNDAFLAASYSCTVSSVVGKGHGQSGSLKQPTC